MRITDTNLFTLSQAFPGDARTAPNQVPATDAPHIRRCLKAGLVTSDGRRTGTLTLTDAGATALLLYRNKSTAAVRYGRLDGGIEATLRRSDARGMFIKRPELPEADWKLYEAAYYDAYQATKKVMNP